MTTENEDVNLAPYEPLNYLTLAEQNPQRGPAIIDGLLREGAVGTLIGGSKTKKSWLVAALIAAALTGGEWLGFRVARVRVLVLDSELTRATILFRLRKVFEALGVPSSAGEGLDIYELRGRTKDAGKAIAWARSRGPGFYGLIILDPLYTLYPPDPHFSENDNAAMRRLFDEIISFAGDTRAAILAIHHLSKGGQAEKSLTDLGAGAGAIARAGDAHLALRPHRERDCVVFDGVVRDFPEVAAKCWRFSFPLYHPAPDLDPADLAGLKRSKARTAKPDDEAWTPELFAERLISDAPKIIEQIIIEGKAVGQGERNLRSLLKLAIAQGLVFKHWESGSNDPAKYSLTPPPSPPTHTPHTPRGRKRPGGGCGKCRGGEGSRKGE